MIAHQFTPAADRDISLAIGIGISQVDTGLGAYGFYFLSIGMAKKPDYAVGIHVLGGHWAAMQTAIAPNGSEHHKIDALDQFVELGYWVGRLHHARSFVFVKQSQNRRSLASRGRAAFHLLFSSDPRVLKGRGFSRAVSCC